MVYEKTLPISGSVFSYAASLSIKKNRSFRSGAFIYILIFPNQYMLTFCSLARL